MHNDSTELTQFSGETNSEETARKVQLFSAGSFHFGVFENEVATIADWREPTPLPHAPESVLGVVSIQGRMLTVMDVAILSGSEGQSAYRHIIALRGDEQLALAASSLGELMEEATLNDANGPKTGERFVLKTLEHAGKESRILNVTRLFHAALQGRERRRRRF